MVYYYKLPTDYNISKLRAYLLISCQNFPILETELGNEWAVINLGEEDNLWNKIMKIY